MDNDFDHDFGQTDYDYDQKPNSSYSASNPKKAKHEYQVKIINIPIFSMK